MAETQTFAFSDPDHYASFVQGSNATGYVLHDSGRFEAHLTRVNMDRLWMQLGTDSLSRSVHLALDPGRRIITFIPDRATGRVVMAGEELDRGHLCHFEPGAEFFNRVEGPCAWASMSLVCEDFEENCRLVADATLPFPTQSRRMVPAPERLTRLRALHESAMRLTEAVAHPEAGRAMENALTTTMIECLTSGTENRFSRRWDRHRQIVSRFREWLEANLDRPVYLLEICAALGVPARTLRTCCEEHLGVGPVRYLWLRRMKLAHRALLQAGPSDTVTDIAMRFGFWELGRFAAAYRALYGETPKASMRRHLS